MKKKKIEEMIHQILNILKLYGGIGISLRDKKYDDISIINNCIANRDSHFSMESQEEQDRAIQYIHSKLHVNCK